MNTQLLRIRRTCNHCISDRDGDCLKGIYFAFTKQPKSPLPHTTHY